MEMVKMIDNKRIVYCLKLYRKEIDDLNNDYGKVVKMYIDNEILNGQYCSDEEYNEYLITGKI